MLGALLAPCGAGQRQMSSNQRAAQPASPAQKSDGARRPELSVSRLRGLGRAPRGFAPIAQNPSFCNCKNFCACGFWLLGHKMNCFA